jgi:hypothetical protein
LAFASYGQLPVWLHKTEKIIILIIVIILFYLLNLCLGYVSYNTKGNNYCKMIRVSCQNMLIMHPTIPYILHKLQNLAAIPPSTPIQDLPKERYAFAIPHNTQHSSQMVKVQQHPILLLFHTYTPNIFCKTTSLQF